MGLKNAAHSPQKSRAASSLETDATLDGLTDDADLGSGARPGREPKGSQYNSLLTATVRISTGKNTDGLITLRSINSVCGSWLTSAPRWRRTSHRGLRHRYTRRLS